MDEHCARPFRFLVQILLAGLLLVGGATSGQAQSMPAAAGNPTLESEFAIIDSLRRAADFRPALARLSSLSQEHPKSVDVLWRYAILWSDYGKASNSDNRALTAYRQAIKMADRALTVDPNSAWAHLAKAAAAGRSALLAGSNRESIQLSRDVKEHADRAIELDSTIAPAYHIRAVWHSEVADLGFVTRTVVKAVYGGLPDASFEQAVSDFKRAIELETRAYNHVELGRTYLKMGKPELAREQFQIALDVPPVDPFAPQDKLKARELLTELE